MIVTAGIPTDHYSHNSNDTMNQFHFILQNNPNAISEFIRFTVDLEAANKNLDARSQFNDFQGNAAIDLFVNNVQGWIQEGIHRCSFTTCSDSNRIEVNSKS